MSETTTSVAGDVVPLPATRSPVNTLPTPSQQYLPGYSPYFPQGKYDYDWHQILTPPPSNDAGNQLPSSLQPGYRPSMPYQIAGDVTASPDQPPSQPNYTVGPVRPGDPGYQPPQQPRPAQVALDRPPAFQLGHQPGPWPAANPNSPRFEPSQAPALPGETPDETRALNGFMAHETGNRGNIINDWAAKNPALYSDPTNPRTCQGYWQTVNSTWRDGAQKAGVSLADYPTALTADYWTQRKVALALYRAYGDAPWKPQPGAGEHGDRAALRPQLPLPPQARDSQDWGHPPPRDFGPGPTGQQQGPFGQANFMQPGQSGFSRVFNAVLPLLLGIGSLALRLPLSTAITAYGAMARAQDNGQREAFQQAHTLLHDNIDAANAQQTQESRAASDAFTEYANNPEGLQQALAQVALRYNDPTMYRMAERGDLNGIHQLQAKRDQYNQDLTKLNRTVQDQQDRDAQDAAVRAMDDKWRAEHPNASQADFDIAHNEHIGEAARAGTKDPRAAGTGMEAPLYNVVGPDGQPTGQQVTRGKNGGLYDLNGQSTTLQPGQRLQPVSSKGEGTGEGMEGPVYDVIGPDGEPTGQQVRAGKQGGLYDVSTQQPVQLKPGERVQQAPREQTPKPDKPDKPDEMEPADYEVIGPDGKPTGQKVRVGKHGGVYDYSGNKITLKPGEQPQRIAAPRAGQEGLEPFQAPDNWDGAPNRPPPGADPAAWALAVDWANTGREPPNMRYLGSGMAAKVANLLPTAQKVLGIGPAEEAFQRGKVAAMNIAQENTAKYFSGGQGASQMRSMNTVAEHLDLFRQYAEALKNNSPVQTVNALKNRLAASLEGKPEVPDFHTAQVLMMDEVVRLLTNTGGTRYDREDAQKLVDAAMAGQQLDGVADTLQNFLKGKFVSLQREYVQGGWPGSGQPSYDNRMWTQRGQWFSSMLLPSAQGILNAPNLPIAGADPDLAAPLPDWATDSGTAADGRFVYRGKDGQTYNPDHTLYKPAPQ